MSVPSGRRPTTSVKVPPRSIQKSHCPFWGFACFMPVSNAIIAVDHRVRGIMRVFLDRLYLFSGYLAGAFMLAIFVLMMLLSAGRPVGLNIPAADDFVSWCMAAMAFLGLAHTFRNGEMIRVGLLIDKLPDRSRHWIEIVCLVIGIGFIGFFAFYACQLIRDSWRFHEMSQGVIAIPMWIPQIGYAAGLVILLIAFVDEFIHVVRGNLPRYEKPKPTTAEEVVERAVQSGV